MAQMGFFDVRYAALDAKNDPLVKISRVRGTFRSRLENVWRKPADKRKSMRGQAVGRHRHESHHFVRPLQSVG